MRYFFVVLGTSWYFEVLLGTLGYFGILCGTYRYFEGLPGTWFFLVFAVENSSIGDLVCHSVCLTPLTNQSLHNTID